MASATHSMWGQCGSASPWVCDRQGCRIRYRAARSKRHQALEALDSQLIDNHRGWLWQRFQRVTKPHLAQSARCHASRARFETPTSRDRTHATQHRLCHIWNMGKGASFDSSARRGNLERGKAWPRTGSEHAGHELPSCHLLVVEARARNGQPPVSFTGAAVQTAAQMQAGRP
jgi:hypothetical protein